MDKFINRKIRIIGEKHPHKGEEARGIKIKRYEKVKGDALLCESTKGVMFCVFEESDIEIIK